MLKNFMGLNASCLSDMLTFFDLQLKLTVCVQKWPRISHFNRGGGLIVKVTYMYFKTKFALKIISVSERDESKTKIKDRLRKLISKRPPIEELEKKGIIKGN